MPKKIDLTGQKFGKLEIIKENGRNSHGSVLWLCKCECGNEITASGTYLRSGRKTSCGCSSRRVPYALDLTGMQFGKLRVVSKAGKSRSGNVRWNCICECGNTCAPYAQNLTEGRTKSCGCMLNGKPKDLAGKRFGKLEALKIVSHNPVIWECRCDCGNTANIRSIYLLNGSAKSCGCDKGPRKPKNDLTGKKFGRLTAKEIAGRDNDGHLLWLCECECGNTKTVRDSSLLNGVTKSCGCLKNNGRFVDLTGQKFGLLTAKRIAGRGKNGAVLWECECDCGNTCTARATVLLNGCKKSCGCMKKGRKKKCQTSMI